MKKKISPTLIGSFVVGAVVLAVAALLIFGTGEFMEKRMYLVTFFQSSVKGLNVGAPVLLKGVNIGKVTEIKLLGDPDTITYSIAVYFEVYPDRVTMEYRRHDLTEQQKIDILVGKGMRAQLESQSFITNMKMIVLNFTLDKPAVLVGLNRDRKYVEVPSVKSPLQEMMEKVENLPIQEIFRSINETLKGIDRVVNSQEITESVAALRDTMVGAKELVNNLDRELKPLSASVQETLRDARKLVRNVDAQVDPLAENIGTTLDAARTALEKAESAMNSIEDTTREDGSLIYSLNEALQELSSAARSLRILADYLDRHPEALLRGRGGSGGN
jgi:paraquat-inducible protein B